LHEWQNQLLHQAVEFLREHGSSDYKQSTTALGVRVFVLPWHLCSCIWGTFTSGNVTAGIFCASWPLEAPLWRGTVWADVVFFSRSCRHVIPHMCPLLCCPDLCCFLYLECLLLIPTHQSLLILPLLVLVLPHYVCRCIEDYNVLK
jgi:hypothetical protein